MEEEDKKRIYLDFAAATPVREGVQQKMWPFFAADFGNASSIHSFGLRAKKALEEAREKVARVLEIKPEGVTFTGGGTEGNFLAIFGHLEYLRKVEKIPYEEMEVVTTKIEHPSISELVKFLEEKGVKVKLVEVDSEGIIKIPALRAVLSEKTVLVSFAYANSEVGTVQPVLRLVREIRKFEKERREKEGIKRGIFVHLDAAQAPLWLPCAIKQLGVDAFVADSGKFYGPKGVGIVARPKTEGLLAVTFGGGQEDGLRSGTENVAGIVGLAEAFVLAQANWVERAKKVAKVRDEAIDLFQKEIVGVFVNGAKKENRLANNINISLPNFDTEYLTVYLDRSGIAVSTKSACAGAGGGESAVVKTLSSDAARARSTLRLSLGEETTLADLKYTIEIIKKFQAKMSKV